MTDRLTARLNVTEDGQLMMINRLGTATFAGVSLHTLETIGTTHYIRWDAGFEKAMDMAEAEELEWLASLTLGDVDREELMSQVKHRKQWKRYDSPCGDKLVYLLKWYESA